MRAGKKLHIELPKGKGLQTVMSLLLLFLCGGSFAFGGSWRGSEERLLKETDVQATVNAEEHQGYHIVLDAGHGAKDSGKVGINGDLEKDINLAIVAYLQELLQKEDSYLAKMVSME